MVGPNRRRHGIKALTRTPKRAAGVGEHGKVLGEVEVTLQLQELSLGAITSNPLRLFKSVP